MFLFATLVACVDDTKLHIDGAVEGMDGESWTSLATVSIFEPGELEDDGAVFYDQVETEDGTFAFDVPAGEWVVTSAAGTCSGEAPVSGSEGESITLAVAMVCVE